MLELVTVNSGCANVTTNTQERTAEDASAQTIAITGESVHQCRTLLKELLQQTPIFRGLQLVTYTPVPSTQQVHMDAYVIRDTEELTAVWLNVHLMLTQWVEAARQKDMIALDVEGVITQQEIARATLGSLVLLAKSKPQIWFK
mmetsp:Transcript_12245/g.19899  ORF Transcript_12245/g.19899 Transcript_12245/m.19899 type:complete len:144 (-) Transcript_12245:660-1091(-)